MNIHQHSDKAIINWQQFNIGRDARVQFHQNSANAVALNRVLTGDASQIHGTISANGHVYLINPSGVVFGQSARVDVGGLVASTHDITDEDFFAGKRIFHRNGATGKVVNNGNISGKNVALIGTSVNNQGQIVANGGDIALAAGERITLDAGANGFLQVAVDGATLNTLAQNGGLLQADGGQIILTAQAANAAKSAVVNTGVVRAQTLQHKNGQILLLADMNGGETRISGTLDASAPDGGDGGFIETSAAIVNVENGTRITTKAENGKTGTWLIDPDDFTIAATGGNISGTTLSANLENTNQIIETNQAGGSGNGDLFVNDAVAWTANTELHLRADRNIYINKDITSTGAGANLILEYGRTTGGSNYYIGNNASVNYAAPTMRIGQSGSLQTFTVINDVNQLQAMTNGGRFALGSDIDASITSTWNAGAGYNPLSNLGSGQFHGLGHVVDQLFIYRPGSKAALFGSSSSSGIIRDAGLTNINFTGGSESGGFVGGTYSGVIMHDVYVTGTLTGNSYGIGGLIGRQWGTATIRNAYTDVTIIGVDGVGGLVGDTDSGTTTMNNVYATGNVTGANYVGGLVGQAVNVNITNAYSAGDVTALAQYAGGIFGDGVNSNITNAYAGGAVTGLNARAIIAGSAVGTTATNVYWNTDVTPLVAGSAGIIASSTGLTSAQMIDMASFAGFDIGDAGGQNTVWRIYEGQSAPLLRSFLTPITITANDATGTSGTPYSGGNGVTYSVTPDSTLLGSPVYSGTSQGAATAGTYAIAVNGYYSTQQGYDISYANGQLVLTAAPPPPPPPPPQTEFPRENSSTLYLNTMVNALADTTSSDGEAEIVHARDISMQGQKSAEPMLTMDESFLSLQDEKKPASE